MDLFVLKPFVNPNYDLSLCAALGCHQGHLKLHYVLSGQVNQILWPKQGQFKARANQLWQTTCFEFFLSDKVGTGYFEFNFSPSGEWNCFRFSDYRKLVGVEEGTELSRFEVVQSLGRIDVIAQVNLQSLQLSSEYRCAPTTVLEDQAGEKSYWALAHQSKEPDFHAASSLRAQIRCF